MQRNRQILFAFCSPTLAQILHLKRLAQGIILPLNCGSNCGHISYPLLSPSVPICEMEIIAREFTLYDYEDSNQSETLSPGSHTQAPS